jgi:hypothetical protein
VPNICIICKNGYSLFKNYCLLPSQIQAILTGSQTLEQVVGVSNTTSTTTSNSTTTVTTNTTTIIIDSNMSMIANCLTQNNGICTQCNENYVVVSGKCQAAVKNCAAYNLLTGICIACSSGFTLQNQQCVQT